MVEDGKKDCFAYKEVRGRLVCYATSRKDCIECPFYKHRSRVDMLKIEQDIKRYGGRS